LHTFFGGELRDARYRLGRHRRRSGAWQAPQWLALEIDHAMPSTAHALHEQRDRLESAFCAPSLD